MSERIEPRLRTIDGLAIRFAESERREARRGDALLSCPWPESLHAYEPTWLRLVEHAHLIAFDLSGFGHSKRTDSLMTPRAMGEFVVRAADAFELENPHALGPDIGTSAALFAAALHPWRSAKSCHRDRGRGSPPLRPNNFSSAFTCLLRRGAARRGSWLARLGQLPAGQGSEARYQHCPNPRPIETGSGGMMRAGEVAGALAATKSDARAAVPADDWPRVQFWRTMIVPR